MLNVIRYSQIIGLVAVDSATATHLGQVKEIWLDNSGHIAYLSSGEHYLPLEQISGIGTQAVSTYGHLAMSVPSDIYRLHQLAVHSVIGEPVGWIDDFLFDWHTGQIMAYLLAGDIAEPFGGRAVLYPEDVETIVLDRLIIREGGEQRLKREAEGLKGFLSEKSHQIRHLVKVIGDRLHDLITPHDQPGVVRVKIKDVSDELAASGHPDHHTLKEATDFLHDQWQSLQHSISGASQRAKTALESAWKHLKSSNS
jgi:uncharacterized protein YrrD